MGTDGDRKSPAGIAGLLSSLTHLDSAFDRDRSVGRVSQRVAALLVFGMSSAIAQPIYKSLGPDGQITYSSKPPPTAIDVEHVEIPPGPAPAEQAAAEARMQAVQAQVEASAARRQVQEHQVMDQVEKAESAVREAKTALQEAKARENPEDWQTIVRGGRVPSASYLQRVEEAEERLQQAKQELQRARRAAR